MELRLGGWERSTGRDCCFCALMNGVSQVGYITYWRLIEPSANPDTNIHNDPTESEGILFARVHDFTRSVAGERLNQLVAVLRSIPG